MDNLKWRSPSRIVAIIDLILSSLGLLMMISFIVIGTSATLGVPTHENLPNPNISEGDINMDGHVDGGKWSGGVMWVMWIVVVLASFIVVIDLWAGIMLLKATKKGADHVNAAMRARIWRNVNIILSIHSLTNLFSTGSYAAITVGLVFRGTILYIVVNFIKELDQVMSPSNSNLDNIGVVNNER